ncbi:MAG: hypothetical protein LBM59_01250 [Ruminococcus sp.]|jgi:hypothetical protein|nr:hypothetical protein [Ruminococcus sp.]
MSTREMLKHDIDILPDNALPAVSEFISLVYRFSDTMSDKSDLEKGYQLLLKNKKKINPPIDETTEKMDYLDEKYGSID